MERNILLSNKKILKEFTNKTDNTKDLIRLDEYNDMGLCTESRIYPTQCIINRTYDDKNRLYNELIISSNDKQRKTYLYDDKDRLVQIVNNNFDHTISYIESDRFTIVKEKIKGLVRVVKILNDKGLIMNAYYNDDRCVRYMYDSNDNLISCIIISTDSKNIMEYRYDYIDNLLVTMTRMHNFIPEYINNYFYNEDGTIRFIAVHDIRRALYGRIVNHVK